LTAGPIPDDPVKLLSSYRMAALMVEFEANYDLIILDAPPILGIVDTVMIAALCGGVVLVERIGRVHRQDLIQAAAVLNRLNVIGVIPNGVDNSNNRYAYEPERIDSRSVMPRARLRQREASACAERLRQRDNSS
jgi:polysaccharide biosynthesis transport protein